MSSCGKHSNQHSGSGSSGGSGFSGSGNRSGSGRGSSNCVSDILNFINDLQECASSNSSCPSGCSLPYLGANHSSPVANTRPFILYTQSGAAFQAFFQSTHDECGGSGSGSHHYSNLCASAIFRVESIDESCAVLRVLAVSVDDLDDGNANDAICTFLNNPHAKLVATNSCVTIDLSNFLAVQCLKDVSLPCL